MRSDATTEFLSKKSNINLLLKENQKRSKVAVSDFHAQPKGDKELIEQLQDDLEKAWGEIASLRKQLEVERGSRKDAKLDRVLDLLNSIKDTVENKEKVIVIKETSFEEAYQEAKKYIKGRDLVDPLDLADDLQIPYGLAHEIVIKLHEEGLLEPDE